MSAVSAPSTLTIYVPHHVTLYTGMLLLCVRSFLGVFQIYMCVSDQPFCMSIRPSECQITPCVCQIVWERTMFRKQLLNLLGSTNDSLHCTALSHDMAF